MNEKSNSRLKEKSEIKSRLHEEVLRSSRYKNKLTVILIEIDDFNKLKNDLDNTNFENTMQDFLDLLIKNTREVDLIGRLKPNQYLVICPNTGIMGAKIAAQRIRKITEFSTFNNSTKLTISAGVKEFIYEEADKLLKETKKRLKIAKNKGKNRVVAI